MLNSGGALDTICTYFSHSCWSTQRRIMGVALYIVLEQKPADFDPFVNGKALSHAEEDLAKIAEQFSVKPLMSFFNARPEEVEDFLADEGIDPKFIGLEPTALQWFESREGLHTFRTFPQHLKHNQGVIKNYRTIFTDLQEFAH